MNISKQEAIIRVAVESDFAAIREVVHEVWPIAYGDVISQDQISYMLQMMYSDDSLQKQINEEGCMFLVYERDKKIQGFASFSQLEGSLYKLHKLYVYSHLHGNGIGAALLSKVKQLVAIEGGNAIELQVNKKNIAQHFYLKQGFTIDRELVLDIGNGFVMDDYIMKLIL
jgi:GNAT superfamily N-acetyltransferase